MFKSSDSRVNRRLKFKEIVKIFKSKLHKNKVKEVNLFP